MPAAKPSPDAPFSLFTPEQLAKIHARVDSWLGPEPNDADLSGTERMAAWLERRVAFQTIMAAMIAEGEVILPGKGGIGILARVLQNFGKQAEQLLEVIRGEEEKK